MSDIAIRVENLSKKFRIGTGNSPSYHRLSEAVTGLPRMAWNALSKAVLSPRPASCEPMALAAGSTSGSSLQSPASDFSRANGPPASEFWALKDVSFEIKKGEVVGIIGRNGAGKSTLLKILSRITEPTSGRFGICGRVASLLEVGTGFHPELTGRENIFVSGITLGMTRAEIKKRFDEIVDFSGVEKFLDTPVKHYSSGMQVRLGFAVAAHLESEILIVDEVLAVGDAEFQRRCTQKLHQTAQSGKTVLFVSHSLPALERLCGTAIWLDRGSIAEIGSITGVVSAYTEKSEARWSKRWEIDPSRDSTLRVEEVRLVHSRSSAQTISVLDPIFIEIHYYVVHDCHFRCAISVTSHGECVLTSVEPNESFRHGGTHYVSKLEIPANLLTDICYTIGLSIFRARGLKEHFFRDPDVLTFCVNDPLNGNTARGDYSQRLLGLVNPKLEWCLKQVRLADSEVG